MHTDGRDAEGLFPHCQFEDVSPLWDVLSDIEGRKRMTGQLRFGDVIG